MYIWLWLILYTISLEIRLIDLITVDYSSEFVVKVPKLLHEHTGFAFLRAT